MAGLLFHLHAVDYYLSARLRPASIRIYREPLLLHASWDPHFNACCYLTSGLEARAPGRSHPDSTKLFNCDYAAGAAAGSLATIRKGSFHSPLTQLMQQYSKFRATATSARFCCSSGCGLVEEILGILSAAGCQFQPPLVQIAVLAEPFQNLMCSLDQRLQFGIACLADSQFWPTLA